MAKTIKALMLIFITVVYVLLWIFNVIFVAEIAISGPSKRETMQNFKAECSIKSDASGSKYFYHLPDGMEFTIWEKESGVYGSEVLIIPGIHKRKTEPENSYIRTLFTSVAPTLYYSSYYGKHKKNMSDKDTIILRWPESDKKQDLFEIINKPESSWNIAEYKDSIHHRYAYYGPDEHERRKTDDRLSFFTTDITGHYAQYEFNERLISPEVSCEIILPPHHFAYYCNIIPRFFFFLWK